MSSAVEKKRQMPPTQGMDDQTRLECSVITLIAASPDNARIIQWLTPLKTLNQTPRR